jgi:hypothetical protein
MKRALLCLLAFACLWGCGRLADAPAPKPTDEINAEAPTTTEEQTARALQPLPENCRLLEGEEKDRIIEKIKNPEYQDSDLLQLTGKTFHSLRDEKKGPYLLIRDDKTSEETIIAWSGSYPRVSYIIDDRHVIWTDYFRGNDFHGIYDTKRDRHIQLNAGGYINGMYEDYIYAMAPKNYWWYGGTIPGVYKTSLNDLDRKDKIEHSGNLIEGLLELDWNECYTQAEALSPDYQYHAARTNFGLYVFDLHIPELVMHIPASAIPGNNIVWREPDYGKIHGFALCNVTFTDNNTLYLHEDIWNFDKAEPCAIEIKLP